MTNNNAMHAKIIEDAVVQLRDIDLSGVESVQVNHTKYDDGSALFEVGVSFPAGDKPVKPTLDELVAKITPENHRVNAWQSRETDVCIAQYSTTMLIEELDRRDKLEVTRALLRDY